VDHAQERDGSPILGQDRRSGQVELDLGLGCQLAELVRPECVERRPRGKEPCDLAQRRVQLWTLDIVMSRSRD
jgi:hypothetical protein